MSNFHMAHCQKCRKYALKRNLRPIYSGRTSDNPKIICFLCEECFVRFLEDYEISE